MPLLDRIVAVVTAIAGDMKLRPTDAPQDGKLYGRMDGIWVEVAAGAADSMPVNTVAPVLTGSTVVGSLLSVTTGTWNGSPAPTFAYQWYADEVAISGATGATFTTTAAEAEALVHCEVTATNTEGSASADSNTLTIDAEVVGGTYAPTVVISGTGRDAAATVDTTGCDAFVAVVSAQSTNNPGVSDSRGGSWVEIANWTSTDGTYTNRTRMFLCQNIAGAAGHIFTPSAAGAGVITVIGLDKNGGTIAVDQKATAISNDSDSPYPTNPITPTVPESLAIAAWNPIDYSGDGSAATYNAPFVSRGGEMDGTYWTSVVASAELASTASVTATMNNTAAPTNSAGSLLLNLYCTAP